MKILHIIPSLHGGGAEKFAIDLCNELSNENEVVVCSLYNVSDDMFMAKKLDNNVKLITLNKKLGIDISIYFKILRLLKSEKVDIVNTHLNALFYSILPVIFTSTKFFHTVHNLAQNETRKTYRLVYKIFFKFFNVTPIAISKKVLKSIQEEYGNIINVLIENGVKKPKISRNYDTVKQIVDSYKVNDETKVFINIGRISPQKNQKMLIEVFNRLADEGENIILLIIGEADSEKNRLLKDELLVQAKDRIHFLGLQENVADFLACSDAFCLSSLYEGLPITLLESLAMGVVPVCTPAGGIVDVLSSEIGILSKDFSAEAYYREIRRYLDLSLFKRDELRKKDIEIFTEKYDISRTKKNYLMAYKKEP